MWFKNAFIFRLTRATFFSQLNLEQLLSQHKFRECGATEMTTFGWASALPDSENLVHSVDNNNYQLIRACSSTKALPADFVKREVDKKVKEIEDEQCRKATKKEKEQLKEDVLFAHLPNAFPTYKFTNIYLDNINELVIIETATRGLAEDILALLRKCIGTLPVTNYFTSSLQQCLNDWISKSRDLDTNFVLGGEVQLTAPGDSAAQAKFSNEHDVTESRISTLVSEDERDVNHLSMAFAEAFHLTLDSRGFIKKLKPFDVLVEQNEDIASYDHLARLDADFVLFAKEMSRLFSSFKDMEVTDETEREPFDAGNIYYPEITEQTSSLETVIEEALHA